LKCRKETPWVAHLFFLLLLCWVGVLCGIYKSSYNISNMSYLNSPLHCSPSLPHSWNSFNRYHQITFTCLCTHFLHWIHPPTPFPHHFPHPTRLRGTNPPPIQEDMFHPPVVQFSRRKKKRNDIFACLRYRELNTEIPCAISIYVLLPHSVHL
jgi:hypothetical protein